MPRQRQRPSFKIHSKREKISKKTKWRLLKVPSNDQAPLPFKNLLERTDKKADFKPPLSLDLASLYQQMMNESDQKFRTSMTFGFVKEEVTFLIFWFLTVFKMAEFLLQLPTKMCPENYQLFPDFIQPQGDNQKVDLYEDDAIVTWLPMLGSNQDILTTTWDF